MDKKKIINFINKTKKSKFCQSPLKWMKNNNYEEYIFLLGKDTKQTKKNFFIFAFGKAKCVLCGKEHERLYPGWRGWAKTCSEECCRKLSSKRQSGDGNTSHRMSEETKKQIKKKMSDIMKGKILRGEFTPKTENYKLFGTIDYHHGEEIRKVRSLWEMIYWMKNPDLEYEKIRVEYWDKKEKRKRIYIADFYDKKTNTVIEVKPKKYQHTLKDKKKACIQRGYNFLIIDEDYMNKCKTDQMIEEIEKQTTDYKKIKKRLKWLKKV